jgi:transposase-like protein
MSVGTLLGLQTSFNRARLAHRLDHLTALLDFTPGIRKALKKRSPFPNDDESIQKILCLAPPNASKKGSRPIRDCKAALSSLQAGISVER